MCVFAGFLSQRKCLTQLCCSLLARGQENSDFGLIGWPRKGIDRGSAERREGQAVRTGQRLGRKKRVHS